MKLISCHVENFGRLHDFDYVFSNGINVICRENGWGKSTFAAFLLAMFYGLSAKGRRRKAVSGGDRLPEQNARTFYRPWQGGVYGGQIVFEAGGRTYEMSRIFGERESQDEFELRDFDTNLPSFDYSTNIGREMFALDRDSFLRTVFTGQQDCATYVTDDVNSLIADLAEYAGDMESYENAQKRLREAANRLTPKRATGRLCCLSSQIGQLQQKIAASEDLEERIALCSHDRAELERKEKNLEAEKRQLTEKIIEAEQKEEEAVQRERANRDLLAKQQILARLVDTKDRRRADFEQTAAFFPQRIPSRAEADELLQNCRKTERLEERMQARMLTEEEQERLTFLEERFSEAGQAERIPEDVKRKQVVSRAVHGKRVRTAAGSGLPVLMGSLLVLAGVLAALAGVRSDYERGIPILVMAAAILLAAAGAGLISAGLWKRALKGEKSGPAWQEGEFPDENLSRAYTEYLELEEKELKIEEMHAAWAEARRPVLRFLSGLGFVPGEDLSVQIAAIRDAADDCEDAAALLREAEEELRLFRQELDRSEIPPEKIQLQTARTKQPAAGELRDRREQVQEELLECRAQLADLQNRLEDLLSEQEEREAMMEEIRDLREQQQTDEKDYRYITTASALLQKARESLIARYADPIRRSFSTYWEMITGYSAAVVHVDADARVTVEERGKQRDTARLSTGWQDLAGICLRLALADAMYPTEKRERPPLILDDPFTSLDDEKVEGAMRFLHEAGRKYQVLYFTCSSARC